MMFMPESKVLKGKGEFDYDYLNDILFFKIKGRNYVKSIEVGQLTVDIDEEDFITGLQIEDASKFFRLPKISLKNVKKWQFEAKIENKEIEVRVSFQAVYRNKAIEKEPIVVKPIEDEMPESKAKVVCEVA